MQSKTATSYVLLLLFTWIWASPSLAKPTARELKPHFLHRIRSLQETELSDVTADSYAHLLELCLDAQGEPNPRVTCTNGYGYAASYVEEQMKEIGLTPLGNTERTSYTQVVEGSVHETYCPPGIINIIGMVPGTLYPDEYVIYSAHLDGPNNENPQTATTRGNGETSNAYDDGLAVAVGLAIARQLMDDPPLRSVIFLFDDGEEGWKSVGAKDVGETAMDVCRSFRNSDWYKDVYEITGGPSGIRDRCPWDLIGTNYWIMNPTVEMADIVVIYVIDPLGSPYDSSTNALAVLGGEQTDYGTGTLNDFLDDVWPSDSTVQLLKAPRSAVRGFGSSMDGYQNRDYQTLCRESTQSCLRAGGIPGVWLAQPAFQKYHGGAVIDGVKDLFGTILGSGTLPSPAYFQEDNLSAFYLPNLDAMLTSLLALFRNTADNENARNNLSFNRNQGGVIDKPILRDVIDILDVIISQLSDYPSGVATTVGTVIIPMRIQAALLLSFGLSSSSGQSSASLIAQAAVGFAIAADFFFDGYEENELFLDQSIKANENDMKSEPFAPTPPPTVQSATTAEPTSGPTKSPTQSPTSLPTKSPTTMPTATETTMRPTLNPTTSPSSTPSNGPTSNLTQVPTSSPTAPPTAIPTMKPTVTGTTLRPTFKPTISPSDAPSNEPTASPSNSPSNEPTVLPSNAPSKEPTKAPSLEPTTILPSTMPSLGPTTLSPTKAHSLRPTPIPSVSLTKEGPTDMPSADTVTTSPSESSEGERATPKPTFAPTGGSDDSRAGASVVFDSSSSSNRLFFGMGTVALTTLLAGLAGMIV